MRIVGGRLRGRALVTPKDQRVRPTSDRVRESLFNILAHNDFGVGFRLDETRVLDLFAGTGALGCEALSRGARFCLFVDSDADSRGLVRENVDALGLTGASKIWKRDATALGPMPANANGPYGLVFCDAPYRQGLTAHALMSAREGGWLTPDALVLAETADDESDDPIPGFELQDTRTYGETRIALLLHRGG
ncbi:MAG: 16S rRNA (guanine(966)-N(2))-methyltransferase RsmD [Alphaproteobacteria bacterium]|nr:16S rRNA (guanine(966)-N(2))-methyltransferase RsmD [Alphaproteobacteria bacterium]